MSETITKLTIEGLRDNFQSVGYRVETLTDPVANTTYLRSATAGLGFEIRPGNQLVGEEQSFVDTTLVTTLQVQGELPLDLVNRWNTTRRFGRLQFSHPFLMFCMDISVAGGVAPNSANSGSPRWFSITPPSSFSPVTNALLSFWSNKPRRWTRATISLRSSWLVKVKS